jgi:uncharacterized Zn-binding protein involved in type VI secretion
MVTPGTGSPHVGGPITGPGCGTVLIEGLPAATAGDVCLCAGATDKIVGGSTGVYIGGKPAARMGDKCMHGGVVIGGSGTVLIGESMGGDFFRLPASDNVDLEFQEPSAEEKKEIINQMLIACVTLLKGKHKLLKDDDSKTLEEFNKWFGTVNENAKQTILKIISKALRVCKKLTIDNFEQIYYEKDRLSDYAIVYNKDKSYRIFLGDSFWQLRTTGRRSKAGVLIHELSHFKRIGDTKDHAYNEEGCLLLVKVDPVATLHNADSFEFFIEA